MRPIHAFCIFMFSGVLLGCQTRAPDQATGDASGDCNASAAHHLIGEQATPTVLDQARRESGAGTARMVRPGDIVTLEYNYQRLTLVTNENLVIERIGCN